jgi:hypothetical protein
MSATIHPEHGYLISATDEYSLCVYMYVHVLIRDSMNATLKYGWNEGMSYLTTLVVVDVIYRR